MLTGRPSSAVASLTVMRDGDNEGDERKERRRGFDERLENEEGDLMM